VGFLLDVSDFSKIPDNIKMLGAMGVYFGVQSQK
jgi:hypothetical protein